VAAPALLGRLCLAGAQRAGVRLSVSFTFIKSLAKRPKSGRFAPDRYHRLKKTAFSNDESAVVYGGLTVLGVS
jgi:hypothetical protein